MNNTNHKCSHMILNYVHVIIFNCKLRIHMPIVEEVMSEYLSSWSSVLYVDLSVAQNVVKYNNGQ